MIEIFNAIADGLATDGYAIVDNFLIPSEVNEILSLPEFKNEANEFKKAGIGKNQSTQINEAIRGDHIQWVDKITAPAAVKVYLAKLDDMMKFLNQNLFLSLKDYEIHLTIYPTGSFYKRHLDHFKSSDHRKLSIICYLNNHWQEEHGGQLRMHLPNVIIDVLPIAGRLVCFRSDEIEHEVLPATRERLSITGWILDQFIGLTNL